MTRDELWAGLRFIALGTLLAVAVCLLAIRIGVALFGGLFT